MLNKSITSLAQKKSSIFGLTYTDDNNNYAKIATKLTNSIYQIKLHTKSLVDKIEFRVV